jgi:sporulation protein YlmC with PRC-barrel domain
MHFFCGIIMTKTIVSTSELYGTRVLGGKSGVRRIGKVRYFVFHPNEKRCIGFIVKRPDFLWMFRRKDKFVSIKGYDLVDGRIRIRDRADATDSAACKALGVNWDDSVLWIGLPLRDEAGEEFGRVGGVVFNRTTGAVQSIESDPGATKGLLLGKREIPARMIKGFRKGVGAILSQSGQKGQNGQPDSQQTLGAILVTDEVRQMTAEGGLAEKAGQTTAVVMDKASKTGAKASEKAKDVAKVTGEAINKGARATGKQLGKTKGMFSTFKKEYKKARHADDEK